MTLDFILCQSTKGTKKVEMKNASLKAFQMTNLVQQQRGPALALGFARICTNPPMNSEFEMKQGQISFQLFLL